MSKFSDDVAALTAAETTYETVLSVIQSRIEADQTTIATLQNEINELESEDIDTTGLEEILAIIQEDATALEAAIAAAPDPAAVTPPAPAPVTPTPEAPTPVTPTPVTPITPVEPTAPVTAPTVAEVAILPNTVSLTEGSTQQFSATVTLSDGTNETNFTPIWTAENGTISASGAYVAPAGSVDTVTVNVAGITATAAVTITQASTSAA